MATETTLKALANLVKLLPTGTVFLFMFLNTLISNNASPTVIKKIAVTQYGIVTISGRLWPHAEVSDDYKLKVGDFAHALLSLIVLGVLVLLILIH
ncbi:hypothetical protein Patl1_25519 [Pistacia atlantica]|uniref:Uncharacterized protein n=1 Tax=Pistacia atlantica TaxID=434234 RepID=A0ACC1B471_9ROSI|nr:hypothetical protein Patl1_25519 [Pistacia atlantica]